MARRADFYVLYDWHGGETLQQQLDRQKRLGVPQVLTVGVQALKALGRLHRQGVIHRDIKPANLHQGDDGVLRVLDLGVALSGCEPKSMRASRHNPEIQIWLDHVLLKAVARDKRQRFETAEEFLLALERDASRPLSAPQGTPLMQHDPTALWKVGLAVSLLFNLMLIYWLVFLPK